MTTKLFLGLAAGLLTIAQAGRAQNTPSDEANELFLQNGLVGVETISVVNTSPITLAADKEAGAPTRVNDTEQAPVLITYWNFMDEDAPQTLLAVDAPKNTPATAGVADGSARRQTYSSSDSPDWLNIGGTGLSGLVATTPSNFSPDSAMGTTSAPEKEEGSAAPFRTEDRFEKAGTSGGDDREPMLASPEPGTVSLLMLGGVTFFGVACRRKQTR